MFAPHTVGIAEDPATGSATGPLGAYLVKHGLVTGNGDVQILSEQGTKMGLQSMIHIRITSTSGEIDAIEVSGSVVPVLEGELRIPKP